MSGKRTRSFEIAVHHRETDPVWRQAAVQAQASASCQDLLASSRDFINHTQYHLHRTSVSGAPSTATTAPGPSSSQSSVPPSPTLISLSPHKKPPAPSLFTKMVTKIAIEFLPDERDRKYYADNYRCWPPPLFVIFITIIELSFFLYYTYTYGSPNANGPVPVDSIFIFRPDKRLELWRWLFYMVLHAGWIHLFFNLTVQLLVGLPLEMVHGSWRIAAVYMAGVLAGSLGTSVFDPDVYLVGASGGVYALLAAHLANVLLNYHQMEFGILRLLGVFFIASADVGFAIYDRYAAEPVVWYDYQSSPSPVPSLPGGPPVSYVAHLTGALAGLTIGLIVLKNFEQKLHEQLLWWVALGIYAACTLFAVLFNLFN